MRGDRELPRLTVMPWWSVAIGLGLAVVLGLSILAWLFSEAERGGDVAALRIEAIRTALTVVAGTGGAVALLLAARRQWLSERRQRHDEDVARQTREHEIRVQEHNETVARANQLDLNERRLAELFARAVEELGSDSSAVQFGGLYSLERLAQEHEAYRLAVTEVLCAYLRTHPDESDRPEGNEVTRSAQHILALHCRAEDPAKHWPGMHLHLPRSRLHGLKLGSAMLAGVSLSAAVLNGRTDFSASTITDRLGLADTDFAGAVAFRKAKLANVELNARTRFRQDTNFDGTEFTQTIRFDDIGFDDSVAFRGAVFGQGASYERCTFQGSATFSDAVFKGMAMFRRSEFLGHTSFINATFADLSIDNVMFHSGVTFEGAVVHGQLDARNVWASRDAERSWPDGCREVVVDDAWVALEPQRQ